MHLLRNAQHVGVGGKACGETLHLAVDSGVVDGCATVDIVIAKLAADDNVLNVDVVAIASGTAAGDDAVGVELVDHALGTQSGIHLAYTTLLNQNVTGGEELL